MKRSSQISLKDHAELIRNMRHRSSLSVVNASLLCGLSKNMWASIEKAERPLPKPAFELFCLKTGESFERWSGKKMHLPEKNQLDNIDINLIPREINNFPPHDKLAHLRRFLTLSVSQISPFGGVSMEIWRKMERGQVSVSAPCIELICQKFQTNVTIWAVKPVYIYNNEKRCIQRAY